MFWPEHVLLDGCFSFKTEDLVFIWSCPDDLHKSYKYRGQYMLQSHMLQKVSVRSLSIWSRYLCWYSKHVSPAYRNTPQSTACGISLIYSTNNKGPRMDPCGTSHLNSANVENLSWTFTSNVVVRTYHLNQPITSLKLQQCW